MQSILYFIFLLTYFTDYFYCLLYFQIFYLYTVYADSVWCHAVSVFVCPYRGVWTLGVWGELACHKRLFNPPPQFSRLGTWCPAFVCVLGGFCIWVEGLCVVSCRGGGCEWLWVLSLLSFYL